MHDSQKLVLNFVHARQYAKPDPTDFRISFPKMWPSELFVSVAVLLKIWRKHFGLLYTKTRYWDSR